MLTRWGSFAALGVLRMGPGLTAVAAIYDDWACLGSANFDKLSFQVNKEMNLATSHPKAVNDLP